MSSKVDLVNQALTIIGNDTITSLDDGSRSADLANTLFDSSLETLLQEAPWNFALGRATLARLATTPEYGYTYQYQLPSDCLQVISFQYDDERSHDVGYEYVVEDDKVLTDQETCRVLYVKRVTDMNKLSPLFKQAFIAYLAAQLAPYTTNTAAYAQGASQQYAMFLRKAKVYNARESRKYTSTNGSWLTARV